MCLNSDARRQCFKRVQRLLKPAEFNHVFEHTQKKVVTGHFVLLSSANTLDRSRLGLVIAKRRLKLAVQRNRIKRLCREVFRTTTIKSQPFDLIIMLRQSLSHVHDPQLADELRAALAKLERHYTPARGSEL